MTATSYILGNNLYVNLTNQCPNTCDFCIREQTDHVGSAESLWYQGPEPSAEEILTGIINRDLSEFSELVFCGYGEPFCRLDDLLYIAAGVREVSPIPIRVNTNGQGDLLSPAPTLPRLAGLVDTLSISLNAPTAAEYDRICHSVFGQAAFPALLKFAADAKAYVPNVCLSVVDTLSFEKIEECQKLAAGIGVPLRVRKLMEGSE